jgi:hypothetical protein
MKNIFLLLCAYCAFLQPKCAYGQDAPTETVTIEGVGKTEASAKKAAFREAIQKVVGVLIDANTQVKNEEIIKDEVLEYSGGFISKSEILSSKKDEEGLVRVKVKCVVEKTQVKKKLEDIKVLVVKVDGAGFAEKEMSKEEIRKDAANIISKALEERKKIYSLTTVSSLEKIVTDEQGYSYIPVSVGFDDKKFADWVKNWLPIFEKMYSLKKTGLSIYQKRDPYLSDDQTNQIRGIARSENGKSNKRQFFFLSIAESLANNGTTKWSAYKIECDMTKLRCIELVKSGLGNLNVNGSSKAKLQLELQDQNGKTLAGSETNLFGPIKGKHGVFIFNPERGDYGEGGVYGAKLRLVQTSEYTDCLELPPFPGDGIPGEYGCIFKLKIPKADLGAISKIVAKLEWDDVETKGLD